MRLEQISLEEMSVEEIKERMLIYERFKWKVIPNGEIFRVINGIRDKFKYEHTIYMLIKNVFKRRIEKMALDYLKELQIEELESVEVTGIIDEIDLYYEDDTKEFMSEKHIEQGDITNHNIKIEDLWKFSSMVPIYLVESIAKRIDVNIMFKVEYSLCIAKANKDKYNILGRKDVTEIFTFEKSSDAKDYFKVYR